MRKERLATFVVVLVVLFIAAGIIYLKNNQTSGIPVETAKCIGANSILYVQTGCSHCKDQEDLFGDNLKYLNMIDCLQEGSTQKCISKGIQATPTWIIKNQSYTGVQSIEKLKEITNC